MPQQKRHQIGRATSLGCGNLDKPVQSQGLEVNKGRREMLGCDLCGCARHQLIGSSFLCLLAVLTPYPDLCYEFPRKGICAMPLGDLEGH